MDCGPACPTCAAEPWAGAAVAATPAAAPGRALVLVDLPEGAQLYVDGRKLERTGPRRTVVTPAIQPRQAYTYTLRAVVVRDGKPVEVVKRVAFRADEVVSVSLAEPTPNRNGNAVTQVAGRR